MFFDPKKLTDDQLFEKQLDLTKKRLQAARFGKPDMANQLQTMIQAIEFERRERMFNSVIGKYMLRSSPVVIETDPVLKEKELQAEEQEDDLKPTKPANRHVRIPVRTLKPVKTNGPTS